MLFGINLADAVHAMGVLGILGIVFAESGMLIGFFLPGDTLLFTAGFLTQQGVLEVNIHALVILIALAAIAGDNIGYYIGRRVGRKLFTKSNSLLFQQENLHKAENFYEKFGPITVLIARFIPVVRTFAPVVTGVGNMSYITFLVYDVVGALLWSSVVTYLGYYGGAFLQAHGVNVELLIVPVVVVVVLISIVSPIYHFLKQKRQTSTQKKEML
ncbi:MAG TPA: VTT domain-containing protein [Candidatus Saccharimonas sp.]|nr:VTT domain-containing protein [Candidatus Saccharimonas sp.]